MKKILVSVFIVAALYILNYGYKNNYHWLLQPQGAILAATDVSENNILINGGESLWPGISPEIGFQLLKYIDFSNNSNSPTTWLGFCLNSYDRSLEETDPERVKRIYKVAQYLIGSGIDINERPVNGFTVLEGALLAGDWKMYHFLINNGADSSAKLVMKGKEGMSLLVFAQQIKDKTKNKERSDDLDKIINHLKEQNITKGSS